MARLVIAGIWLIAGLCLSPPAMECQTIKKVKIEKLLVAPGEVRFKMTILGEKLGGKGVVDVTVTISPEAGLAEAPKVAIKSVSQDGRQLVAEFTTEQADYLPRTVQIDVTDAGRDVFRLPVIDDVRMVAEPAEGDGEGRTYALVIVGSGFGSDTSKVDVEIWPPAGIKDEPKVLSVEEAGTELIARFSSSKKYEAEWLVVRIDGAQSLAHSLKTESDDLDVDERDVLLKKHVHIWRSIMDPKSVSDVFGKRISTRYVALTVTIQNRNKDYEFLIHELSVDLSQALGDDWQKYLEHSSRNLALLRGVAEKGRVLDRRNIILNTMKGIGRVAAGLVGITGWGPSYADAVSVFQGPLVGAYEVVFPDFSIEQINRLNDLAYEVNTVVPKLQSKVVVVFLPQRIFLNKKQRDLFWNEPSSLWDKNKTKKEGVDLIDLRKIEVALWGDLVAEVETLPPDLTQIVINRTERAKFGDDKPKVEGYIAGRFLMGSDIDMADETPTGIQIKKMGAQSDTRIPFMIESDKPVPADTILTIRVTKKGYVREVSTRVKKESEQPIIEGHEEIGPEEMAKFSTRDAEIRIALRGQNLEGGTPRFAGTVRGLSIVEGSVEFVDGKLTFRIKVDEPLREPTSLPIQVINEITSPTYDLDVDPTQPVIQGHEISEENMKNFGKQGGQVEGVLNGQNLEGCDPKFAGNAEGLSIKKKDGSSDTELKFVIMVQGPITESRTLKVVVTKEKKRSNVHDIDINAGSATGENE